MLARGILSPLTNTPISSRHPPNTKYVSPSTSRQLGVASSLSSPTLSLLNDIHDEEKERRDRRRSRVLELQRNFGTSPGSPSDRRATPLNGFTSFQLAEHYANCIQLSAENKINSKNAFGLHLIDYMAELLKKKELENFQVASSTLDASAKIYAGRVDFIHSETYKVLSGLGTGTNKQTAVDAENGEDATGEDIELHEDEQKKKKKARKSRTIETNLKNINVNKFDLEFEVDPMFQKMSATFDEGGAGGLLLNHLRCYDDSQLLVLDSSAVVPVVDKTRDHLVESSTPVSCLLDITEVKDLLEKMNLNEKQICPALSDFRLIGWDGSDVNCTLPKGLSDFVFDPLADPAAASALEDDISSLPGDTDPADLHEISDTEGDVDDDAGVENTSNQMSQMKGDIHTAEFIQNAFSDLTQGDTGKLLQILATQPTDYSYFNKVLMRTWAGPSHWKTAPMSRDPSFRISSGKAQKSKSKRPPFQLTYDGEKDLESKFKTSKLTMLTRTTLQKYSRKRTTLPEDLHFQADQLFRLFLRKKIMIKRQTTSAIGVDDGLANYDYDNVIDRENYCPDVEGEDDDEIGELGFNFSDDSRGFSEVSQSRIFQPSLACNDSGLNVANLTGDKLLSQPYKVAKVDINYAKTAKHVDVRKLKSSMWTLLTSVPGSCHIPEKMADTSQSNGEKEMTEAWSFQSLLQALPSCVSSQTAQNLSVPIAFVCLLHLANEKVINTTVALIQEMMGQVIVTHGELYKKWLALAELKKLIA